MGTEEDTKIEIEIMRMVHKKSRILKNTHQLIEAIVDLEEVTVDSEEVTVDLEEVIVDSEEVIVDSEEDTKIVIKTTTKIEIKILFKMRNQEGRLGEATVD